MQYFRILTGRIILTGIFIFIKRKKENSIYTFEIHFFQRNIKRKKVSLKKGKKIIKEFERIISKYKNVNFHFEAFKVDPLISLLYNHFNKLGYKINIHSSNQLSKYVRFNLWLAEKFPLLFKYYNYLRGSNVSYNRYQNWKSYKVEIRR